MGGLPGRGHFVDGVAGRHEEEDLESGVVVTFLEGPEDIEVAGCVDEEVEGLRFEGYTRTGLLREYVRDCRG
jgi:hypothetical protein